MAEYWSWALKGERHTYRYSEKAYLGEGAFMSVQVARKQYKCNYCEGHIPAGDWYVRFTTPRKRRDAPKGDDVRCNKCPLPYGMSVEHIRDAD